jgi:uncharacterized membrane protein
MNPDHARHPELERRLALLLRYGTWLGSLVIAVGLGLTWIPPTEGSPVNLGMGIVTLGVAIFIFLPITRVALMLAVFLCDRDYRFAAIALTVLTVIALGAVLGTYLGAQAG